MGMNGTRKTATEVESVMIEVNRSLYMDEESGEKIPGFEQLQKMFRTLWSLLESYLAKRVGAC
jgi:N-formylglutamate amidohydrolase